MVALTITRILLSLQQILLFLLLLIQGTTVGETTVPVTSKEGTTAASTTAEGMFTFKMRNSSAWFLYN